MTTSIEQPGISCRGPGHRVLGEDFSLRTLGERQIACTKRIRPGSSARADWYTNGLPNCFTLLVAWRCWPIKILVSYSHPRPLLFVVHVHELCTENEIVIWCQCVAALDCRIFECKVNDRSFIAGHEYILNARNFAGCLSHFWSRIEKNNTWSARQNLDFLVRDNWTH